MKVLVTGLGSIGQRHVRNLREILGEGAEIWAFRARGRQIVIDAQLRATFGQAPEERYGLRTFPSLEAALEAGPDVVFVTNPIALHAQTALAAARRGCHVFIEKPLSDRWDGIDELVATVRGKGVKVGVGYQLRFHPALRQIYQSLQEKRIGRICSAHIHFGEYLPSMHLYEDYRDGHAARRREGGGAILCLSHELDYAYWLFGHPRRVFAVGGHLTDLDLDVEDTASLLFEYVMDDRTVPVYVSLNFIERPPSRTCTIVGDQGTIAWDYYRGCVAEINAGSGTCIQHDFSKLERNSMFVAEVSNFLDSISGGRPMYTSLEEGVAVLRMALVARTSLEERRVVELPV